MSALVAKSLADGPPLAGALRPHEPRGLRYPVNAETQSIPAHSRDGRPGQWRARREGPG